MARRNRVPARAGSSINAWMTAALWAAMVGQGAAGMGCSAGTDDDSGETIVACPYDVMRCDCPGVEARGYRVCEDSVADESEPCICPTEGDDCHASDTPLWCDTEDPSLQTVMTCNNGKFFAAGSCHAGHECNPLLDQDTILCNGPDGLQVSLPGYLCAFGGSAVCSLDRTMLLTCEQGSWAILEECSGVCDFVADGEQGIQCDSGDQCTACVSG